jgi:hypothetical protein
MPPTGTGNLKTSASAAGPAYDGLSRCLSVWAPARSVISVWLAAVPNWPGGQRSCWTKPWALSFALKLVFGDTFQVLHGDQGCAVNRSPGVNFVEVRSSIFRCKRFFWAVAVPRHQPQPIRGESIRASPQHAIRDLNLNFERASEKRSSSCSASSHFWSPFPLSQSTLSGSCGLIKLRRRDANLCRKCGPQHALIAPP